MRETIRKRVIEEAYNFYLCNNVVFTRRATRGRGGWGGGGGWRDVGPWPHLTGALPEMATDAPPAEIYCGFIIY